MSLEEHHKKPLLENDGEELVSITEKEMFGFKGFVTKHKKAEVFKKDALSNFPLRISHKTTIEEIGDQINKVDEWELFNTGDVILSSIQHMGINHGNMKQQIEDTKKNIELVEKIYEVYKGIEEKAKDISKEEYAKRMEKMNSQKKEKNDKNEGAYIG